MAAHALAQTVGDGRLAQIVRYPVKGLAGVATDAAELVAGGGLRHDRGLAVARRFDGRRSDDREPRTAWKPRESFLHMARDEYIARLQTELISPEADAAVLSLVAGDGRRVAVRLSESDFEEDRVHADRFLRDALPPVDGRHPVLERADVGLWDWPAAHVSIINLATVRALADAAGRPVDRRRFRGNLYLDDLEPWAELGLLGRRVRIGSVVLEVFQPTDRCRATTIDPLTATSDLNVPALLASRIGHMFCGVYARVVEPGRIAVGDRLELAGASSAPPDAEPEWPRRGIIARTRPESSSVTSIWIDDPLGIASTARPGQHVRIQLPGESAPAWRCYTVSGVDDGLVRISVKRDGRISRALHAMEEGQGLILTGPAGEVILPEGTGDVLLVSAGIGITPTVAMLRALAHGAERGDKRRVRVLHIDRVAGDVPLWEETDGLCDRIGDARATLFLTREREDAAADVGARAGRPALETWRELLAELELRNLAVFLCGPTDFTREVSGLLADLGVPEDAIGVEVFFSPTSVELTERREPSTPGPHAIRVGDEVTPWTAESGSILDAVEREGIQWAFGCRVGACGTCARRLVSGDIEYLSEPIGPRPRDTVLVCCAAPLSDVTFAV